jgi:hypothetical protein
MRRASILGLLLLLPVTIAALHSAEAPKARGPKEALQAFNDLIGSWRATGTPEGTTEEQRTGFWTENLAWEWQFKGDAPRLVVTFTKGKHFRTGALSYLPGKDAFQLTLRTANDQELVFEGTLRERALTLDRQDAATQEGQRFVLTLLHENRFLYRYEVKPAGQTRYSRRYQVGATKEGVAFAGPGSTQPECIVSGGLGTMKVSYQGKDYYVCCSGCRDAFKDEPEKYIKEYEAKKAKR